MSDADRQDDIAGGYGLSALELDEAVGRAIYPDSTCFSSSSGTMCSPKATP